MSATLSSNQRKFQARVKGDRTHLFFVVLIKFAVQELGYRPVQDASLGVLFRVDKNVAPSKISA